MNVVYSAMFDPSAYPFGSMADRVEVVRNSEELKDVNSVLVLWGGADIDPSIYGHPKSRTCYTSENRDKHEVALAREAIALGIPIIGVCRGAQLLCAVAGGYLIQDTTGHGLHGGHDVTTHDGRSFSTNSLHHQMLAGLENVEHELLAWSTKRLSKYYTYKDDRVWVPPIDFKEPELVYFPTVKGLACQWHPEGMSDDCEATEYLYETMERKWNVFA